MYGLMGKLLFVDLSTGKSTTKKLDEDTARNFVGGPALGAKILYDEMPAHTDVFAPESLLGFVCGALNGTGALLSGRYTVVSKSPVTNGWNDANSGGTFGARLKKAGYDAVFVKGIASTPSYIFIDEDKVEIRDASHLWGMTTIETEDAIREELNGIDIGIALIAPAGERKSRMAAIMNDAHRSAARGGTGAVMGSKNLKALVICGSKTISVADKDMQTKVNKKIVDLQKNGPMKEMLAEDFTKHGTSSSYEMLILAGDSGVKNWAGSWTDSYKEDKYRPLTGQEMDKKYYQKRYACSTCPLGCGAYYKIEEENCSIEEAARPEYETLGTLGSLLLNADPVALIYANHLCNEYGMDTISVGGTLAWLMECYEKGTLSAADMDGIEMTWGNADAIIAMTKKICMGEGVGQILQEGSRYAADHFGKGHEALVDANGIEIPAHDPRFAPGIARTYRYDPTPGRHVKGGLGSDGPPEVRYNYEDTGERDVAGVVHKEIMNACGVCEFSRFVYPPEINIELLSATTGFVYTEEEQKKLGKRMFIIRQAFNLREGFRRKDYAISDRVLGKPPLEEGPIAGITVDVEKLADNFIAAMGFDSDMVPKKETLEDIGGLEQVMKDLYK